MQITIEVSTPLYDSMKYWMRSNAWEVTEEKLGGDRFSDGDRTVFIHHTFAGGEKYAGFDSDEAERVLKFLNFGHPTRTLLELWAEIMDVPDLLEHTVGELLAPAD